MKKLKRIVALSLALVAITGCDPAALKALLAAPGNATADSSSSDTAANAPDEAAKAAPADFQRFSGHWFVDLAEAKRDGVIPEMDVRIEGSRVFVTVGYANPSGFETVGRGEGTILNEINQGMAQAANDQGHARIELTIKFDVRPDMPAESTLTLFERNNRLEGRAKSRRQDNRIEEEDIILQRERPQLVPYPSYTPTPPVHQPDSPAPIYTPGPYGSYKPEPYGSYIPEPYGSYKPEPYGSYVPEPYGSYKPEPYGSYVPEPYGSYKPEPYGSYVPEPYGSYQPPSY
ncbi:MAG: hypothetical protein HY692_04070 [Cyanobacteria bacterium NC_groundwater_1444_Ag_S-0.65um_54_12]|nr:hypothetical protein [Cyanobacteria bacterium NC_groundwater_1444_Ag_S-0.65um_54_12]